MDKVTPTSQRKDDHLRINLEENVQSALTTGLEAYHLPHNAVPEIDFQSVHLETRFLGHTLHSPLLISSMTGGSEEAQVINHRLAEAAQETRIAMGLGSLRAAIEKSALAATFQVREVAPDILLFANLGAVQLNYGYDVSQCRQAVEMVQADALVLHFNPLQEVLQPEGDGNFARLLPKIEKVCSQLEVPVIAKEVGWGISAEAAGRLIDAGIQAIDVAGAGGTSWSEVEMHRAKDRRAAENAGLFVGWGIPTAEALRSISRTLPEVPLIASGGLRDGLEIGKCIALGADLAGLASPFLKAASQSTEEVILTIRQLETQLKVTMFACGCSDLDQLRRTPLQHRTPAEAR